MDFVAEKIKQTNKFNLDGLGAKRSVKKTLTLAPWQKVCIALTAGAILALSGPGFDQWWLAWFMVAPFLIVLGFCRGNIEPLLVGLSFGLGYHLIGLHYYLELIGGQNSSSWQIALPLWFIHALELSLPDAIFAWIISCLPLRPGYIPYYYRPFFPYLIAVPLLWIFLHWGLASVVNVWHIVPVPLILTDSLAYSQYGLVPLLQITKYIGPIGLEFCLLLFNSTVSALAVELIKKSDGPLQRVDSISPKAGALIDLLIAISLLGFIHYFGKLEVDNCITQFRDLETNNGLSEQKQPILPIGIIIRSELLNNFEMPNTDRQLAMIIFPERNEALDAYQTNDISSRAILSTQQSHGAVILSFPSMDKRDIVQQNSIAEAGRINNPNQPIHYGGKLTLLTNILFGGKNDKSGFQRGLLPFSLQEWLLKSDNKELSKHSSNTSVQKMDWGRVALLSGAGVVNPRLVADEVRKGASLIISSTNLSWTHNNFLTRQLLATSVFRAAENHRYVVLCIDDKIAAVIEPNGVVQSLFLPKIKSSEKENNKDANLLLGKVQFLWSKTPFTKAWWL